MQALMQTLHNLSHKYAREQGASRMTRLLRRTFGAKVIWGTHPRMGRCCQCTQLLLEQEEGDNYAIRPRGSRIAQTHTPRTAVTIIARGGPFALGSNGRIGNEGHRLVQLLMSNVAARKLGSASTCRRSLYEDVTGSFQSNKAIPSWINRQECHPKLELQDPIHSPYFDIYAEKRSDACDGRGLDSHEVLKSFLFLCPSSFPSLPLRCRFYSPRFFYQSSSFAFALGSI